MSFKTMFKISLQISILFRQENLCDGCNAALDLLLNGKNHDKFRRLVSVNFPHRFGKPHQRVTDLYLSSTHKVGHILKFHILEMKH